MPKNPKYTYLIENMAAGGYSVHQPVAAAHAALTRLLSHVIPEPAKADPITDASIELVRAAHTDGPLLTRVPGLVKADDDARAASAARQALEQATVDATATWESTVVEHLEDVITTRLAPVYDQVVAEARECWPLIAGIVAAADAVAADEATRAAYLRFEELALKYGVLRDTAARANDAGEERIEHQSRARHYVLVRNPADCWADFSRLQHQVLASATPPWDGTNRERLAWLAAHPEAQAWLPTTAQLNTVVLERHGADIAEQQRSAAAGRSVHAWGGRAA